MVPLDRSSNGVTSPFQQRRAQNRQIKKYVKWEFSEKSLKINFQNEIFLRKFWVTHKAAV